MDWQGTGGLGYSIGLSLGVVFLIIITTIAYYMCINGINRSPADPSNQSSSDQDSVTVELGLDEATLLRYPKLLYSQAKLHNINGDSSTDLCCSICLADYKETDMLRLLPDCGHFFHLQCADSWLRLHPTCPICRDLPVPTPLATLSEAVSLAMR